MTKYTLSLGASIGYQHPHADRTAVRNATSSPFSDLLYQVWPSRKAMARTIRMQQQRAPQSRDWRPLIKLADGEGY